MNKYLYGASVQGIQGFIFETNKLAEIVGASEMIEKICTEWFRDYIDDDKKKIDEKILLSAAGNIKITSETKEDLKRMVREFHKRDKEDAHGITNSQAVVEDTVENGEIQE